MQAEPIGLADGLDVGGRERGVKGTSKAWGLSYWQGSLQRTYIILTIVLFSCCFFSFFFQVKDSEVWGCLGPGLIVRERGIAGI